MKKVNLLLCLLLLLGCVGCGNQNQNPEAENGKIVASTTKGQYAKLFPYNSSPARYWHGNVMSRFDAIEVEKGLERRAQAHFSTKEYLQASGSLLDSNALQMLQRRESSDYPYGLNPPSGSFEVTEAITVDSPYLVYDIVEMDFYHSDNTEKIAGIALTILLNSTVTASQDGAETTITIPANRLYTYGSNIGRRLELYMRQLTNVEADCPIYISLYASAPSDSSLPGTYIGEALFTGRSGQFREINEQWALFPSDTAQSLDATLYSQVVSMKNSIHDFLPENLDLIGLGRFEDNQIRSLKLTINVQAKTYSEVGSLAQYVAQLCDQLDTTSMDLSIEIKMFDKTYFTMVKKQGESTLSIHDLS